MGYQESWVHIQPQHKFKKLIQAYEKAEQTGYYKVAGAEPRSVIVLKQPFGELPAGTDSGGYGDQAGHRYVQSAGDVRTA